MKEAQLVRSILEAVKKHYPRAYARKVADRYRRGVPDIEIIYCDERGRACVLFVECKTTEGRLSPIQRAEMEKINGVGMGCLAVVVSESARTVLEHLKNLGAVP